MESTAKEKQHDEKKNSTTRRKETEESKHSSVVSSEQSQLKSPPVRLNSYKLGKTLGHGSFGKVKLAEHSLTGQSVAIKIISRQKILHTPKTSAKMQREIQTLLTLNHPHITKLYEVIETPTEIFLVMEFAAGGDLFDYVATNGKLSEDKARGIFRELLSALAFCHYEGVVHRDLKLENLLLSRSGSIKVADFGLANVVRDGEFLKTSCGSPNFAAPEIILGDVYVGPEVDVWSAGVILYALLCGSLPFDDGIMFKLFKKVTSGIYLVPYHLSSEAKNLIAKMLCVDPMKRITVSEIHHHPWFQLHSNPPPHLGISPTSQKAATKRAENEVNEDVLTALLNCDSLSELKPHRAFVKTWITTTGEVVRVPLAIASTSEKALKFEKITRAINVSYRLLLDVMTEGKKVTSPLNDNITQASVPLAFAFHQIPSNNNENDIAQLTIATTTRNDKDVRWWYLGIQSKRGLFFIIEKQLIFSYRSRAGNEQRVSSFTFPAL